MLNTRVLWGVTFFIGAISCKPKDAQIASQANGFFQKKQPEPDFFCSIKKQTEAMGLERIGTVVFGNSAMPASWGAPWPKQSRPSLTISAKSHGLQLSGSLDGANVTLVNGYTSRYKFPVTAKGISSGYCLLGRTMFNSIDEGTMEEFGFACSLTTDAGKKFEANLGSCSGYFGNRGNNEARQR